MTTITKTHLTLLWLEIKALQATLAEIEERLKKVEKRWGYADRM